MPSSGNASHSLIAEASLSIFVVENHADTLKYLKLFLEQLGHSVETATTVSGGIEGVSAGDYDVLISDVGLPDGDGREVIERARPARPVYGIAMSGFGLPSDKSKSEASGFRHHLLKPFSPETLEEYLAEALAEKWAMKG